MELWETDVDNELVVNFVRLLHIDDDVDNKIITAIMGFDRKTHEPTEKTTTVAHLRKQMVACSDSEDALIGAAAMENLTPVSDQQVIDGYKKWQTTS